MDISIRKYNEGDVSVITGIFNEVVEEANAFMTEYPLDITQMRSRLVNDEIETYVVLLGQEVIGGYMLRPNLKERGNHIANATYFVSRTFRRRGIGYLLGKHSLEIAKKMGFRAMQFNSVVATNQSAIDLWKRLGFTTVGAIPKGYRQSNKDFVDTVIMFKEL